MKQNGYIPSLDGIRAISILLVFVSHAGFGHIVPGGFGVTVFFFLSGYLITSLLCREWDKHNAIAFKAFYLRRLLRLSPPIFVTLLVSIVLVSLGLIEGSIHIGTLLSQVFFYFNYFSLYGDGVTVISGLGILWSLAVEEHFYFIWPALFLLIAQNRIGLRSMVGLLVLILAWRCFRYFVMGSTFEEIYVSTDTRFDSILYGCVLALMHAKPDEAWTFPPLRSAVVPIAISLLAIVATLLLRDETFRSTLRYTVQGLALMPLFHYAVKYPDALMFRPLNWRFMRTLGLWSYTIYLIHFVIINGLVFNGIAGWGSPILLLLSGALSVLFAGAVYRFVEVPLHPLRRRLTGHAKAP
jgi:peptidoglycan/LPS O-acetylase OafA/YrhL